MNKFITNCFTSAFLLSSLVGMVHADQTDARLDGLFETLRTSNDIVVLQETEGAIWTIWFASGDPAIEEIMANAQEAAETGRLKIAETLLTQVVEMAPEFSEGWNRRATIRYYMKDYPGSLKDIDRTLALEPRHFGAIWGKGMILGAQQDFAGAISAFEQLLKIKPNTPDAQPRIDLLKQEMARQSV